MKKAIMKTRQAITCVLVNERGTAIVILALAMTVLLACSALVADVGVNYVVQSRLSVAADAAAMAGGTKLSEGQDKVIQVARDVAAKNGLTGDDVIVEVDPNNTGVTVRTKAPIRLFFARIFAAPAGEMEQRARVVAARPVGMYYLFPVGIDENLTFQVGMNYKLFAKKGSTDEIDLGSGNSGALEFDAKATGAQGFEDQLMNGWTELISIGDLVETKSGVKYSAIRNALTDRLTRAQADGHSCSPATCPPGCPRILYIPVYRTIWDGGNKVKEVEIVDFAAFWIDAKQKNNGDWQIDKEINGIFIGINKGGFVTDVGESPYGIKSGKLIQ